jgi:hypothetical protein
MKDNLYVTVHTIHSFINPVDKKYIDVGHVIQLNTITEINSNHYITILLDILHFYTLYVILCIIHYILLFVLVAMSL